MNHEVRAACLASFRAAVRTLVQRIMHDVLRRDAPSDEQRLPWTPATNAGWLLLESNSPAQALEHLERVRELLVAVQRAQDGVRDTTPVPAPASSRRTA